MADLVKFSDAANLAIHAMIDLAQHPGEEVPLKEIAHRLQASEAHLSKVLQRLRKAGLVTACRGPAGGYQLGRPPAAITFAEIYETIEGPMEPHFCLFGTPVCQNPDCGLGHFVGSLNQQLKEFLSRLTLADLPLTAGKLRKMKMATS
ncbi:MAG: Iron-sulfur cluster regulator IscR [Candidatus Ozemobacter sibiricus]|jgi:Rrf2 family protein|uniref:Iron-sulfur cluster regulator IscR n=1 Tax=Candidatus Ozemobacter sibiricus TaxID=2268124 RepID=A0A367ZNV3_9BACT|nr:MAG: Iron-sulfur cluster regulator IscR [Candidatus Ozemobacter sibiricus]